MRRALKIAGALALLVTVAAVALGAPGTRKVYDGAPGSAPPWARPCYTEQPRPDRPLLHRCARVRGRVLHVRREHVNEIHVAVVSHWHVLIVKLPLGADSPGLGSMITATGPLLRIKHGLAEVQAFRVDE